MEERISDYQSPQGSYLALSLNRKDLLDQAGELDIDFQDFLLRVRFFKDKVRDLLQQHEPLEVFKTLKDWAQIQVSGPRDKSFAKTLRRSQKRKRSITNDPGKSSLEVNFSTFKTALELWYRQDPPPLLQRLRPQVEITATNYLLILITIIKDIQRIVLLYKKTKQGMGLIQERAEKMLDVLKVSFLAIENASVEPSLEEMDFKLNELEDSINLVYNELIELPVEEIADEEDRKEILFAIQTYQKQQFYLKSCMEYMSEQTNYINLKFLLTRFQKSLVDRLTKLKEMGPNNLFDRHAMSFKKKIVFLWEKMYHGLLQSDADTKAIMKFLNMLEKLRRGKLNKKHKLRPEHQTVDDEIFLLKKIIQSENIRKRVEKNRGDIKNADNELYEYRYALLDIWIGHFIANKNEMNLLSPRTSVQLAQKIKIDKSDVGVKVLVGALKPGSPRLHIPKIETHSEIEISKESSGNFEGKINAMLDEALKKLDNLKSDPEGNADEIKKYENWIAMLRRQMDDEPLRIRELIERFFDKIQSIPRERMLNELYPLYHDMFERVVQDLASLLDPNDLRIRTYTRLVGKYSGTNTLPYSKESIIVYRKELPFVIRDYLFLKNRRSDFDEDVDALIKLYDFLNTEMDKLELPSRHGRKASLMRKARDDFEKLKRMKMLAGEDFEPAEDLAEDYQDKFDNFKAKPPNDEEFIGPLLKLKDDYKYLNDQGLGEEPDIEDVDHLVDFLERAKEIPSKDLPEELNPLFIYLIGKAKNDMKNEDPALLKKLDEQKEAFRNLPNQPITSSNIDRYSKPLEGILDLYKRSPDKQLTKHFLGKLDDFLAGLKKQLLGSERTKPINELIKDYFTENLELNPLFNDMMDRVHYELNIINYEKVLICENSDYIEIEIAQMAEKSKRLLRDEDFGYLECLEEIDRVVRLVKREHERLKEYSSQFSEDLTQIERLRKHLSDKPSHENDPFANSGIPMDNRNSELIRKFLERMGNRPKLNEKLEEFLRKADSIPIPELQHELNPLFVDITGKAKEDLDHMSDIINQQQQAYKNRLHKPPEAMTPYTVSKYSGPLDQILGEYNKLPEKDEELNQLLNDLVYFLNDLKDKIIPKRNKMKPINALINDFIARNIPKEEIKSPLNQLFMEMMDRMKDDLDDIRSELILVRENTRPIEREIEKLEDESAKFKAGAVNDKEDFSDELRDIDKMLRLAKSHYGKSDLEPQGLIDDLEATDKLATALNEWFSTEPYSTRELSLTPKYPLSKPFEEDLQPDFYDKLAEFLSKAPEMPIEELPKELNPLFVSTVGKAKEDFSDPGLLKLLDNQQKAYKKLTARPEPLTSKGIDKYAKPLENILKEYAKVPRNEDLLQGLADYLENLKDQLAELEKLRKPIYELVDDFLRQDTPTNFVMDPLNKLFSDVMEKLAQDLEETNTDKLLMEEAGPTVEADINRLQNQAAVFDDFSKSHEEFSIDKFARFAIALDDIEGLIRAKKDRNRRLRMDMSEDEESLRSIDRLRECLHKLFEPYHQDKKSDRKSLEESKSSKSSNKTPSVTKISEQDKSRAIGSPRGEPIFNKSFEKSKSSYSSKSSKPKEPPRPELNQILEDFLKRSKNIPISELPNELNPLFADITGHAKEDLDELADTLAQQEEAYKELSRRDPEKMTPSGIDKYSIPLNNILQGYGKLSERNKDKELEGLLNELAGFLEDLRDKLNLELRKMKPIDELINDFLQKKIPKEEILAPLNKLFSDMMERQKDDLTSLKDAKILVGQSTRPVEKEIEKLGEKSKAFLIKKDEEFSYDKGKVYTGSLGDMERVVRMTKEEQDKMEKDSKFSKKALRSMDDLANALADIFRPQPQRDELSKTIASIIDFYLPKIDEVPRDSLTSVLISLFSELHQQAIADIESLHKLQIPSKSISDLLSAQEAESQRASSAQSFDSYIKSLQKMLEAYQFIRNQYHIENSQLEEDIDALKKLLVKLVNMPNAIVEEENEDFNDLATYLTLFLRLLNDLEPHHSEMPEDLIPRLKKELDFISEYLEQGKNPGDYLLDLLEDLINGYKSLKRVKKQHRQETSGIKAKIKKFKEEAERINSRFAGEKQEDNVRKPLPFSYEQLVRIINFILGEFHNLREQYKRLGINEFEYINNRVAHNRGLIANIKKGVDQGRTANPLKKTYRSYKQILNKMQADIHAIELKLDEFDAKKFDNAYMACSRLIEKLNGNLDPLPLEEAEEYITSADKSIAELLKLKVLSPKRDPEDLDLRVFRKEQYIIRLRQGLAPEPEEEAILNYKAVYLSDLLSEYEVLKAERQAVGYSSDDILEKIHYLKEHNSHSLRREDIEVAYLDTVRDFLMIIRWYQDLRRIRAARNLDTYNIHSALARNKRQLEILRKNHHKFYRKPNINTRREHALLLNNFVQDLEIIIREKNRLREPANDFEAELAYFKQLLQNFRDVDIRGDSKGLRKETSPPGRLPELKRQKSPTRVEDHKFIQGFKQRKSPTMKHVSPDPFEIRKELSPLVRSPTEVQPTMRRHISPNPIPKVVSPRSHLPSKTPKASRRVEEDFISRADKLIESKLKRSPKYVWK